MIGTLTAATIRVEVSSQLTLVADVFSSVGRIASTGIRTDCDRATTRAPIPTTTSSSVARVDVVCAATSEGGRVSMGASGWVTQAC